MSRADFVAFEQELEETPREVSLRIRRGGKEQRLLATLSLAAVLEETKRDGAHDCRDGETEVVPHGVARETDGDTREQAVAVAPRARHGHRRGGAPHVRLGGNRERSQVEFQEPPDPKMTIPWMATVTQAK